MVIPGQQEETLIQNAELAVNDAIQKINTFFEGKWKDYPGYGTAKTGFICLQDHGSEAWFRNIKIKKL